MSGQTSIKNPTSTTKQLEIPITSEKIITADIQSLPLINLKLDPQNVRFRHIQDLMTDEELEESIWKESDTKNLLKEIRFSQGLSEKPLVKKISDSEYIVKEGNRRTVCLRKLSEEISTRKEDNIPIEKIDPLQCVVLPEDVDDAALALYLARIHVSGKKPWSAANQGAHVYDLIRKFDYDWNEIAKAINVSKTTINQMVKAFDATMEYHDKYPNDEGWLRRYSHFLELYKRRNLKEWSDDPKNLEQFRKWVFDGKIPMAIQVRKLEKIILEDRNAYQAMQNGSGILEAEEIMKGTVKRKNQSQSLSEEVDSQVLNFQEFMRSFPRNKMHEVAKDQEQLQHLKSLHNEFGRLIKDIEKFGG